MDRALKWSAFALFAFFYSVFLSTNYLNYGAEGILINGLNRLLQGLPYVSNFSQTPLVLSTYSPTFYAFFYPFAALLPDPDPMKISLLVKVLTLLYYIAYVKILFHCMQNLVGKAYKLDHFLFLLFSIFIFKEFIALFCFKPDMHSFFIETIALLIGLKALQTDKTKTLLLSSSLFALAFLIKANTVGMGIGLGLSFLLCRKFKSFLIFSLFGSFIAGMGIFTLWSYLGAELFLQVLETTKSSFLPIETIPAVVQRIIFEVILPYSLALPFFFLGLCQRKSLTRGQALAVAISFSFSFFIASVGQMKYGAYINYYFGSLIVLILFSPLGFANLKDEKLKKAVLTVGSVVVASLAILLMQLPARTFLNDNRNYDFKALNKYIDTQYENPKIYIENNNGAVHLAHRAVTGTSLFAFIFGTPSIDRRVDEFNKAIIAGGGVDAVVAVGNSCQSFKPNPRFASLLDGYTSLDYHKGKICVFSKSSP